MNVNPSQFKEIIGTSESEVVTQTIECLYLLTVLLCGLK
jgi:hypothetical protein